MDEQGYPYFRQPPNITINRPLTLMILPLTSAISKKWQFSTAQSQSIKQYPNTVEQQKATWCWLHFKKKIRVLLGRFLGVFQQSPQDSHFMGPKKTYGFRQVHQESNSFDECKTSIMSSRLVRLGFTYPVRTRGCTQAFLDKATTQLFTPDIRHLQVGLLNKYYIIHQYCRFYRPHKIETLPSFPW
jgi:hypothetical protein